MTLLINGITGLATAGNIETASSFVGDASNINNIDGANISFNNIDGNIIPTATNTYSLGNATNQWQDLWVSNNTVYFGNVPLTVNGSNNLLVNNEPVVISSNTAAPVTANIATTANVIAGNLVITTGGNLTYPDGSTQNSAYDNAIAQTNLPFYTGNLSNTNSMITSGSYTSAQDAVTNIDMSVTGNVYGNNLYSYVLTTGTLTTNAQPNITSVGTLSSLTVAGNLTSANLAMTANAFVNNLSVSGNIHYPGNILIAYGNRGAFYGDSFGFGAWYAGIQAGQPSYIQTTAQFGANYDEYAQINFQNVNTTGNASADFVIATDTTTSNTFFTDLGIASSSYTGQSPAGLGNIIGPNDGYLYVKGNTANTLGGNLVIGTNTSNAQVKFIAGAGDSSNVLMTLQNSNVTIVGTLSASSIIGDASNVTGLVNGNVIHYGTSNVKIATANSNITFMVGGSNAGVISNYNVSLGVNAGLVNQGNAAVAIGPGAGQNSQGANSVAIGSGAGQSGQDTNSVAVGQGAGSAQSYSAVAVGWNAGLSGQNPRAVALGTFAGQNSQGANAIAIGYQAGQTNQGSNSIAIGATTAVTNQPSNSTMLNVTGTTVNPTVGSTFSIAGIQQNQSALPAQALYYDTSAGEFLYGNTNFYTGFNATFTGTLSASQLNHGIQLSSGSPYLPSAASCPNGSKFNLCTTGSSPVTLYCQGGDFIYSGNNQYYWYVIFPGETLEVTSRGTTEWDVTGGTAIMKYTGYNNSTQNHSGFGYKASIPPSSGPATNCTITTYYPQSGLYKNLSVQYQTNGYVWASTTTGTINWSATTIISKYGALPSFNQKSGSAGSGPAQITDTVSLGVSSDTATIYFNDQTNNSFYRIVVIKRDTNNNASVAIERLV